jgi:hypothetical protein
LGPIELERSIGLEEVKMRTDLNGSIAGVSDRCSKGASVDVDGDRLVSEKPLAWDHGKVPHRL